MLGNKREMQTKIQKSTAIPHLVLPPQSDRVGHRAIPQKRLGNPPLNFCLKWGGTRSALLRDALT